MDVHVENVVGKISPYFFDWKIPDFFGTATAVGSRCLESPAFSFSGGLRRFILLLGESSIALFISKHSDPAVDKEFKLTLAVKRSDGKLEGMKFTESKGPAVTGSVNFFTRAELQERYHELLPSGTLTLTCCIEGAEDTREKFYAVKKFTQTVLAVKKPRRSSSECVMQFSDNESLSSDFTRLFASKEACDVTIRVQDKEFQAHKVVLMARSPVFHAMFTHDTKEAQEGVFNEPDCDPDIFASFLKYLYSGNLKNIDFKDAQQLYILSDKYDVPSLKWYCVMCIKHNLTVETFCEVASLVHVIEDASLASAVEAFFIKNCQKVVQTPEWQNLMTTNTQLVDRFLQQI